MLKRIWFILISLGVCCLSISIYFVLHGLKNSFTISVLLSFALLFLGLSFRIIQSDNSKQRRLKTVFLIASAILVVVGLLSKYSDFPGGNIEVILAVLCYCFVFAPIELYHKIQKWSAYSTNKWEMFLLSSLDFLGINLILLGLLSIYMYWTEQYYLIYAGSGLLLAGIVSWNSRFKKEVIRRKESEDKIRAQYEEIEKEKQISERLLLNILPAEVAEELKAKGSADPKLFDEVTVLFTDFKDFTRLSELLTARELVEEINTCFIGFDRIMERHGIEKIKTIGDSYMCAGGLPVANKTHAADVVSAGLEIQQFIQNRSNERTAEGKESFQIRIGIHTGPVVAGIVGIKKFAYDIWGDTVNTASRMESSGEAGKVNISGATYELVKNAFNCTHRGTVHAKGKGEIDMYFVEGKV